MINTFLEIPPGGPPVWKVKPGRPTVNRVFDTWAVKALITGPGGGLRRIPTAFIKAA